VVVLSWKPLNAAAALDPISRRPRHPEEERERLRRLTAAAAVAAIGLNAVLFLQTAAGSLGSGDLGTTVASLISALLPGSGAAPSATPRPAPGVTPHVVSGGS